MQLEWGVRIALIAGGAVVAATALVVSIWQPEALGILADAIKVVGGVLIGGGIAGGPRKGEGV